MRIAQIAPLAESVPPKLYGGTERVVHWLTEELIALGHEVTLFASADSVTRAELVAAIPKALRLAKAKQDPSAACAALLADVAEQASQFDVIHSHIEWIHLPLLQRFDVPFLTTLHVRLDLAGLDQVLGRFPKAPFVSISNDQRRPLPNVRWLATVYHGLPKDFSSLPMSGAVIWLSSAGWHRRRVPTSPSASPSAPTCLCALRPSYPAGTAGISRSDCSR